MNTTVETRPCPACGATLAEDETHWSLFHCPAGCYLCPAPEPVGPAPADEGVATGSAAGRQTLLDLEEGLRGFGVAEDVIALAITLTRSGIALAETEARIDEVRESTRRIDSAFDAEAAR